MRKITFLILLLGALVTHANGLSDQPCIAALAALKVRFHNAALARVLKDGLNEVSFQQTLDLLNDKGTFDIPVHKGFVVAADVGNHAGNYGKYLWLRDTARVYQGIFAKPQLLEGANNEARSVALGMVEILKDPQFSRKLRENLLAPQLHLDPSEGFRNVLWIRRMVTPFLAGRPATEAELAQESIWGHKQNDALAAFAHAILDSLKNGVLHPSDINQQARANLLGLAAYFVRLSYHQMWDVGAWEEGMALRTSSVGLVLSFLQRLRFGMNHDFPAFNAESVVLHYLKPEWRHSLGLPEDLRSIIDHTLEPLSLERSIQEGLNVIRARALAERPIEEVQENSQVSRFEDAALVHLLWYPIEGLGAQEFKTMVQRLRGLERASGYIRYAGDRFLNSAGEGQEAQWTLVDSDLTYFYSDLYLQFGNESDLRNAKRHALRMLAQVTGENMLDLENGAVVPYRFPEAYIPVGKNEFRVSPNSPLNWSTANAIRALVKLREALWRARGSAASDL